LLAQRKDVDSAGQRRVGPRCCDGARKKNVGFVAGLMFLIVLVPLGTVALSAAIVIALALIPLGLLLVPPFVLVRSLVSRRRRLKELRLGTTYQGGQTHECG
jgi:hypothetical protein